MSNETSKAQAEAILKPLVGNNNNLNSTSNNNTRILNHGYNGNGNIGASITVKNGTRLLSEGKDFNGNALNE